MFENALEVQINFKKVKKNLYFAKKERREGVKK